LQVKKAEEKAVESKIQRREVEDLLESSLRPYTNNTADISTQVLAGVY